MADLVLPPIRPMFRQLALAICPDTRRLDDDGWDTLEVRIEGALAQRPAAMRRQFALFVRILQWLTVPFTGRPFDLLPNDVQVAFLHRIERAPVALLRRGLWGLRTLVFLGYYTQPSVRASTGWRGDARGWAGRRLDAGEARTTPAGGVSIRLMK